MAALAQLVPSMGGVSRLGLLGYVLHTLALQLAGGLWCHLYHCTCADLLPLLYAFSDAIGELKL